MLTEQRYEIILRLLEEKRSVTATELKEILDTSESTVRRDITALDKAGKLTKVFGGAVALEHKVTAYEPTVAQKSGLNTQEKKKMRFDRVFLNCVKTIYVCNYENNTIEPIVLPPNAENFLNTEAEYLRNCCDWKDGTALEMKRGDENRVYHVQ